MDTYKNATSKEQFDQGQNTPVFIFFIRKISGVLNVIFLKQKKRTPQKMPLTNTANNNSIKVPFRKNL